MCRTDLCVIYFFVVIILIFLVFIVFLLHLRKKLLLHDSKLKFENLFSLFDQYKNQKDFLNLQTLLSPENTLFCVWQDKGYKTSFLHFKNYKNEPVARMEFKIGAREFLIHINDLLYRVKVNWTWSGASYSLFSPEGLEICRYQQRSFKFLTHEFEIIGQEKIKSYQRRFDLNRRFIIYNQGHKPLAITLLISPWRQIGRIGIFDTKISLPIQVFMLAMKS